MESYNGNGSCSDFSFDSLSDGKGFFNSVDLVIIFIIHKEFLD